MNQHRRTLLLIAAVTALAAACPSGERPCASNADCLASEACVADAEGGRCLPRSAPDAVTSPPADAPSEPIEGPPDAGVEPSDPDPSDPADPVDPVDPADPVDPDASAPRLVTHALTAGAGAAHGTTFRITHRITAAPTRTLTGSALEVRN